MIQAVTFFSPNVGGHDSPLSSGHVNSPSQKGHKLAELPGTVGGNSNVVLFSPHTPLKFNSSPLKSYLPNRKVVFQPPFLRGELLNFGAVFGVS